MAQALSVDLRRRVVEAIEGGMTRRQAALRFGVSPSSRDPLGSTIGKLG
jgi:transposase